MKRAWAAGGMIAGCLVWAPLARAETVLLCYSTNVLRFAVSDGVWSAQGDFVKTNSYGGKMQIFGGVAGDGRRVFVGEFATSASRILEFDAAGAYQRVLATVGQNVEYMCVSPDGGWIYATAGANFSAATTNAAVYRYHPVTGEGGLFIANSGTNAAGAVLWTFQIPRGVAVDGGGSVWVSERSSGKAYVFSGTDGAFLGEVSGLSGIQGLHYSARDNKVYGSSNNNATYVIDPVTRTAVTRTISDAGNRLGVTEVNGQLCGARWEFNDISAFDLATLQRTALAACPKNQRQIVALPAVPLRGTAGRLLVSEPVSNRVSSLTVDAGGAVERERTFAGGEGAAYDGRPLRQPRGVAAHSNSVYVAEGVAGGRVLKFSKWGTFKGVALDFAQTAYSNCVPTALAVAPDGNTLYVTDARTLYLPGNNAAWANVATNGYYATNSFGETVYQVRVRPREVSVFADAASCVPGNTLLDCHGVAVDGAGRVYCTAWFNRTNALFQSTGTLYQFGPDGARQATLTIGNASACHYDASGSYVPAAGNASISGPGILFSGNGMQDVWWSAADGLLAASYKLLDLGDWRNYLDVDVVDGRLFFTDVEQGVLWRRTGDASRQAVLSGLFTPAYLAFAPETGPEPPLVGTLVAVK